VFAWWYVAIAIALVFFALVIMRNSRKFRQELGDRPTSDEIRAKYPKAWVLPLGRTTKSK
jgi:hypothetical protein